MVLRVPIYRCILMGCEAICQPYDLQTITQKRWLPHHGVRYEELFFFLYGPKWKFVKNLYDVPEVVYRLKHEEAVLVRTEQVKIIYGSTWRTISVSYFVTFVACLYMISLFKEILHVRPCHLVAWRYRLWRPSEPFAAIVSVLHARRVKGIMK